MRQVTLGLAVALAGIAVLGSSGRDAWLTENWHAAAVVLRWATGGVLLAGGLVIVTAALARGAQPALMRLDWFLPFLRKKKKNVPQRSASRLVQVGKRLLPAALFADPVTAKPGGIRKVLKRLGPTMLSSPLRRVVQAVCFIAFLVLFFYVCWPYTSHPAPPGQQSTDWQFVEIEPANGHLLFRRATPLEDRLRESPTLHLVQQDAAGSVAAHQGCFLVASRDGTDIALQPEEDLSPNQLDRLLTSTGAWSFHTEAPDRWPSHYTDDLVRKEWLPAETFLLIDPLVSLSTAIASRSWVWSLACAAVILVVCVLVPRGFCGYLCPLGTLIDLFDWSVAGRVRRFRVPDNGWWVHIKYYLLLATLVAALCGVLVSGYVAAIPVITRAVLFLGEPLQSGLLRGGHLVTPFNIGHWISLALFAVVLGLGFLRPRFWCKYVCPSGAVFSLGNLFRVTERKVESTCINCNKCVEICPFDAIKPDFTTRVTDCTLCQTCGGVCPTHAIKFVERWNGVELKVENDPPTGDTSIGRRGFLSLAAGTAAAVVGGAAMATGTRAAGADLDDPEAFHPVRPPGSVPEKEFLQMCIRCGECFKVCPNNVLQSEGFQQGLEGLWTPMVTADWAGCESSCNACGQVCPTGAIRALPLEEKQVARMGLAIVNQHTCLPLAGEEDCDLCVVECAAAGYHAIEFIQVHTAVDDQGQPIEGSGFLAPVVLDDKCVGCGLCQTRCYGINVKQRGVLDESAIIVVAGEGNEDRMMSGSYVQLRHDEAQRRAQRSLNSPSGSDEFFIPGAARPGDGNSSDDKPTIGDSPAPPTDDDPFGVGGL